jgi:hypothetical protein
LHLHACFVRHLDISMDLFIHPKAPTQNTCAHCQRSFSPEAILSSRFNPATFRPGEPPILHHFPFPSTPQFVFLFEPTVNSTTEKRPACPWRLSSPPSLRHHLSEGPRIIQPVFVSSTLGAQLSQHRKPTHSTSRQLTRNLSAPAPLQLPPQRRGANRTSVFRFVKRQVRLNLDPASQPRLTFSIHYESCDPTPLLRLPSRRRGANHTCHLRQMEGGASN